MKTVIVGALLAAGLALAAPGVALAHPGHTSCRSFGEVITAEAQAQIIAPELRTIGPGNIDDLVELVHLGGEYDGEQVPALCST